MQGDGKERSTQNNWRQTNATKIQFKPMLNSLPKKPPKRGSTNVKPLQSIFLIRHVPGVVTPLGNQGGHICRQG